MSPQIGLPHECFAFMIKPTSLVTSWNCWATAADESAKQVRASEMRNKRYRTGDRLIEFVVSEVFVLIKQTFLFPGWLIVRLQV